MDDLQTELRRLRGLYAGLGDAQLLDLLRDRAELTEMALQALDAEVSERKLELPLETVAEAEPKGGFHDGQEAPEVQLFRFNFATDAEAAVAALEEEGIPSRIDRARGRATEDGPEIYVPGLDLLVSAGDQADAKHVLRRKMKLFPLAEVENSESDAEDESLFVAGTFDKEADADELVAALTQADIKSTKTEVLDAEGAYWNVGVDFDDLEPALEVAEKLTSD